MTRILTLENRERTNEMAKKQKKQTVYYAHGMYLYGTQQEKRDIALLKSLGLRVVNPNTLEHQHKSERSSLSKMNYYCKLAGTCDALAFRATPSGQITSGIVKEIQRVATIQRSIPIFELPGNIVSRTMSVEQTITFLKEIGER